MPYLIRDQDVGLFASTVSLELHLVQKIRTHFTVDTLLSDITPHGVFWEKANNCHGQSYARADIRDQLLLLVPKSDEMIQDPNRLNPNILTNRSLSVFGFALINLVLTQVRVKRPLES